MPTAAWRSALEQANEQRLAKARIKRDVYTGRMTIAKAMEHPVIRKVNPRHQTGTTVSELLQMQKGWGTVRASKFLKRCRFFIEDEFVGHLSTTTRRRLVEELKRS